MFREFREEKSSGAMFQDESYLSIQANFWQCAWLDL